jgi:hypothetical protein
MEKISLVKTTEIDRLNYQKTTFSLLPTGGEAGSLEN